MGEVSKGTISLGLRSCNSRFLLNWRRNGGVLEGLWPMGRKAEIVVCFG
jgi:hypothetical protein